MNVNIKNIKAHLALVMVNLIYGANYVVAKEVTPEFIKPFGFIVIRISVAAVMYWLLHLTLTSLQAKDNLIQKPIQRSDWLRLIGCGLFGVAINQMLFLKGLSLTSAINASLIMITVPILVLLMAAMLINERITRHKLLGILLGSAGAAYIVVSSYSGGGGAASNWLGDLCVFINAASYALYLVLVKPLMRVYHPFTVVKWVFFFGWFFIMPFGYQEFTQIQWDTFSTGIWLCTLYVVIAATFFTYLLNIYALQKVEASIVSIYIYTQPVIATIIAISLQKDVLSIEKIIAAVLIFAGVYLVSNPFGKKAVTA